MRGVKPLPLRQQSYVELWTLKRSVVSPASKAQKAKVREANCIVCKGPNCDPAHVIPRSMGGDDDPRAVVPLCRACHRIYDEEAGFDLLPFLEPHYRAEQAYAVELVGMRRAIQRVTNER